MRTVAFVALLGGCDLLPGTGDSGVDPETCLDQYPGTPEVDGDAQYAATQCEQAGGEGCDPSTWMTADAALCFAEADASYPIVDDDTVTVAPMWARQLGGVVVWVVDAQHVEQRADADYQVITDWYLDVHDGRILDVQHEESEDGGCRLAQGSMEAC